MNILYIHQYFNTPDVAGGTRSYYIAKEMISKGHKVTMLTANRNGESSKLISREVVEGICVIRIRNRYDNSMGVARRILSFLNFMILSTFISLREKNVDLIFATSTPLTVGIPALINKAVRKIDYVFEVRDLWPEFPIQMGAIKSTLMISVLRYVERVIYKMAMLIIALSPGMKGPIDGLGFSDKTIMVPNMAKPNEFFPRKQNDSVIERFGLDAESIKIVYFGSLGRANNVQYIVEEIKFAAERDLSVQFVVVGDGAHRMQAQNQLAEINEKFYAFLGKLKMDDVSDVVNECQISLTSFLELPILETNSPNKFFDSLSAGKPTAINIHGWIRDIVENHECGFYVNPSDRGDLVRKSLELLHDIDRYEKFCNNARALAIAEFDRSKLTARVVGKLESVYYKKNYSNSNSNSN